MRCRRVVVGMIVILGTVLSSGAMSAADEGLSPDRWASQVCDAMQPAVQRAVARARTWEPMGAPASVEDVRAQIERLRQAFSDLQAIVRAMRDGIAGAEPPAVSGAVRLVARSRRALVAVEHRVRSVRSDLGRAERLLTRDPYSAMQLLRTMFVGGLGLNAPDISWPTVLRQAYYSTATCRVVNQAMARFASLVRQRVGAGS